MNKKGTKISSSLKFITNDFIEYENDTDMINKINNYLKSGYRVENETEK